MNIDKNTHTKANPCGFALATTIIILALLFFLSGTYMISIQYDRNFAKLQEARTSAVFLARSGIQYYLDMGQPDEIPASQEKLSFDNKIIEIKLVSINGIKHLSSSGKILNSSGKEIIKKTIIAPTTNLTKWHEI